MRFPCVPVALLLLIAIGGSCARASPPQPVPRHLVFVTIDTLRADRVGAYGGRAITPRLDAIAAAGAMARDASAHVPLTLPSHASIFAGRLPPALGVHDNISAEKMPPGPLLAEVLKAAGFTTGGFVSSIVLASPTGLDRGFDVYSDDFDVRGNEPQFISTVQKRGDVTTEQALKWLTSVRERGGSPRRIFLWLHLFDPHDPYEPPEPYASKYAERPYDGEVAWSDELVGRLDDGLRRLGMQNDTLLVVTSDHGEGLGDHGESLHGFFVYQSTLRVPLVVRGPGVPAGTRLGGTVRLIDVFPTVLDMLGVGIPRDARLDGRSQAAALKGTSQADDAPVYAESLVPLLHFGWSDLRVFRDGRWKYIEAPRPELYDLATDPGELTNLVGVHPRRVEALRSALHAIIGMEKPSSPATREAISIERLERLGALGYIGGGTTAPAEGQRADPKDKLEDFRISSELMRQGLLKFHEGNYAESAAAFRDVLARGIQGSDVHLFLARSLLRSGNAREAQRHFTEATRQAPLQPAAWEGLADSLATAGNLRGALGALKRGQAFLPSHPGLRVREAQVLVGLGRQDEALRAYESALRLAPRSARLRVQFGEFLRDAGNPDMAIRVLREAVEIDPTAADAWNSLGVVLVGSGQPDKAEAAFRNAVTRDPRSQRYAYNLGFLLLKQRRLDEARQWFEKSLEADPRFDPARERLREIDRARLHF